MVYAYTTPLEFEERRTAPLLSTSQVAKTFGITRQTVYKWVLLRKIRADTHEIGGRIFLEFDPKEVARVKAKLKKKPEPGKSLLED